MSPKKPKDARKQRSRPAVAASGTRHEQRKLGSLVATEEGFLEFVFDGGGAIKLCDIDTRARPTDIDTRARPRDIDTRARPKDIPTRARPKDIETQPRRPLGVLPLIKELVEELKLHEEDEFQRWLRELTDKRK